MKAFVFDAYGTLFDVHSVVQACEARWPGRGPALSQLWRAKQLEYTWLRSLMERYRPFHEVTRDALEWACASLKLETSPAHIDELMQSYLRLDPYPDVRDTLAKLECSKAILSNGSPEMLLPLVQNSRLEFDAVLSVDEVKVYKPAPRVYELAVSRLRLPPAQIAFVSSNCWDAIGAKSFGFQVYWINRTGAPADRLGFAPDRILFSLEDLG